MTILVEAVAGSDVYEPVAVYDDPPAQAQKARTTHAFVESREGCLFRVRFNDLRPAYARTVIVASLHLDGTLMESYIVDPAKIKSECTFNGGRETPTTLRPFTFSKLALTDDDDAATTDEGIVKAMGTIQVRVMRCSSVGPSYSDPSRYTAAPNAALLHERSKKAQLSRQTGLAAAVPTATTSCASVAWIDSYEAPFAVLELAYRSRALLELNDIVPAAEREPSPVPAPVPAPAAAVNANANAPRVRNKRAAPETIIIGDSDDEEEETMAQKLARLEAENAALKKVKREVKQEVKQEKITVKGKSKTVLTIED